MSLNASVHVLWAFSSAHLLSVFTFFQGMLEGHQGGLADSCPLWTFTHGGPQHSRKWTKTLQKSYVVKIVYTQPKILSPLLELK